MRRLGRGADFVGRRIALAAIGDIGADGVVEQYGFLRYKGAQAANRGSWGIYTAYRNLGQNVAFDPSYDGAWAGTKGWEIGTNYTVAKNTIASLKYFNGEKLDSGKDASKLFGRVEFQF